MNETNTNPEVDVPETEAQSATNQEVEGGAEEGIQAAEHDAAEAVPATDWEDRYLRLYAEFDNYRKRTNRERVTMMETAGKEVIQSLLPVVDDFERGLKVESQEVDALREGQQLVHAKLVSTLEQHGLKSLGVQPGDEFDTDRCEAVTNIPHPELKGKVVDVLEQGYALKGTVLRFAKVVVGA